MPSLLSLRFMRLFILWIFVGGILACQRPAKPNASSVSIPAPAAGSPIINPYATVDISPMDMSYWPADYPKLRLAGKLKTPPLARVIYSRPHLQGRKVFTDILQYEQRWRLGANEATELHLFKDATIENQLIKAGRYSLYCIPHPHSWTFVLNTTTDIWGMRQEPSTDLARFEVPLIKTKLALEYFTMVFQEKEEKAELVVAWENFETRIQFKF